MSRLPGIALLMLLLCVPAAAQTQKAYVSAGFGRQAEAGPSGTTIWTPNPGWPGGAVNSLVVGAGVAVNRIVSIDSEVAVTGSMHARQPSRYFTLIQDRREIMMTGGVRSTTAS